MREMNSAIDRAQELPAGNISREIAEKDLYRELRKILKAEDCFTLAKWSTVLKGSGLLLINISGYLLLLSEPTWGWRIAIFAALAVSLAQCGFLGHDAFHRTLSGKRRIDDFLGQLFVSFFSGLSYSYFFDNNHRLHHAYCGIETLDPEMQSKEVALYPTSARAKTGLFRWISRYQAFLLWVLMPFNAFFMRNKGMRFVWRNQSRTRADQIAIALHFIAWLIIPGLAMGLLDAVVNYLTITWMIGTYLTGIFPFYHVSRNTYQTFNDASILRRQVECTRNMSSSWLVELYTGGTNNHIEHHLYPRIPTPKLRRARPIIRDFCRRHGIDYEEISYRRAFWDMVHHLALLSRQVPSSRSLNSAQ